MEQIDLCPKMFALAKELARERREVNGGISMLVLTKIIFTKSGIGHNSTSTDSGRICYNC
jgi:hypothetical protein